MVETAKQWMPVILNEKPDLVVGLFHSGWDRNEGKSGVKRNSEVKTDLLQWLIMFRDLILFLTDMITNWQMKNLSIQQEIHFDS